MVEVDSKPSKRIRAEFFRTINGVEPVRKELKELGRPAKTIIGEDILFVEQNWPLDRPYVDLLKRGRGSKETSIYEVRHTVDKVEFRTLFFVYKDRMILLQVFKKKRQKTPPNEIETAWKRMKLWMSEEI